MAEITKAQARRICLRLGLNPDHPMPYVPVYGKAWASFRGDDQPAWRIAQRAAAEGADEVTDTDKLEPGWYWVKVEPQDGWLPCDLGDHG